MSAAKIRKELKLRMVKQSGTKKELSNRLKFTTLQKKLKFTEGKMKTIKEKKKGGKKKLETKELKFFPATAHWRDFKQNNGQLAEPDNPTSKISRAPTVPEANVEIPIVKHNFDERMNIPEFTGEVL